MNKYLAFILVLMIHSTINGAIPVQTLNLSNQGSAIGGTTMSGQQSGQQSGGLPFSGGGNQQGGFFQNQQGGSSQNQQGGSSQNQQGGQVATLTATSINNGYARGTQVRPGGTSVRLNLRLLPQQRQQITSYRQYRLNLRLGSHGFIQNNNTNNSGSGTTGGTTGGGTTGGGTTSGGTTGGTTGGGTTSGGTTGGGTTGGGSGAGSGTTGGGSGAGGATTGGGATSGGIPTGAVGMQAQGTTRN